VPAAHSFGHVAALLPCRFCAAAVAAAVAELLLLCQLIRRQVSHLRGLLATAKTQAIQATQTTRANSNSNMHTKQNYQVMFAACK